MRNQDINVVNVTAATYSPEIPIARIAVLIVNWNSWSLLEKCLDALSKQHISGLRILVLDNASHTHAPPGLMAHYPEVEFFHSEINLGFAGGNNRLLERTNDCDWIALVNPDAFVALGWLDNLFVATAHHPEYTVFASRLIMKDRATILDGDGDTYHMSGLAWRTGHGDPITEITMVREVFSPCAAAALYRRDALMAVGGFDEDFFCYMEDVDLGFRLRLAGHRCLLVPSAMVYHIGSATTGGQQSDFAVYHGHRNLVWTYVKNMPGLLFWLFLPFHILINISSLLWFTVKGKGRIIIKAKWDALKQLPAIWHKRKPIQASRKASLLEILRVMDKSLIPRLANLMRFLRT